MARHTLVQTVFVMGQMSDVPATRMVVAKGEIVEDDGQRMHTAGELEGKKIYWMGFVRS